MVTVNISFLFVQKIDYKSIQSTIKRISYLAKARGKGYKPKQTIIMVLAESSYTQKKLALLAQVVYKKQLPT